MSNFTKLITALLVAAIALTCTGCSERAIPPKTEASKPEAENVPSKCTEFYALDVEDGSLTRFAPPQVELQCGLLDVSRKADGLQYIYSVFDNAAGTSAYYRYHSATEQIEPLQSEPRISYDQNYSADSAHYIEYAPDFFKSIELRIRPLE